MAAVSVKRPIEMTRHVHYVFGLWQWWDDKFDEFDHLRSRNPIEVNRTIGVRLGSISKRSIDYTRIYTRVLVEYDIKGKYPEKYSNVDKVKSDKR